MSGVVRGRVAVGTGGRDEGVLVDEFEVVIMFILPSYLYILLCRSRSKLEYRMMGRIENENALCQIHASGSYRRWYGVDESRLAPTFLKGSTQVIYVLYITKYYPPASVYIQLYTPGPKLFLINSIL